MGPLLFLLYMNDLPKCMNNISVPVLFAYDTNILFSDSDIAEFNANINTFEIANI
jgi:hypothetical protein